MENNLFGLKEGDLETIRTILKSFPQIEEALIFGSRAKGNYKPGSDVDIVLRGNVEEIAPRVNYILNEESLLPYKFDVLDYRHIDNPKLVDHIDRLGIVFYRKKEFS